MLSGFERRERGGTSVQMCDSQPFQSETSSKPGLARHYRGGFENKWMPWLGATPSTSAPMMPFLDSCVCVSVYQSLSDHISRHLHNQHFAVKLVQDHVARCMFRRLHWRVRDALLG